MKEFKDIFSEDVQKLLSEESLQKFEETVQSKIDINVETALNKQDEVYAEKLQKLVESIDKDRTRKLKKVVEAIDKKHASKLLKIVKLYERDQKEDAKKFKKSLVQTIDAFLDEEVVKECVDNQGLEQAVKNKTAFNVLENLRKVLSVDSVMMKESVQEAILDGKSQLDEKNQEIEKLKKQNQQLLEKQENFQKEQFLEEKCSKFSDVKKNFIKKTFKEKTLDFVKENFDYVIKLYDKQEKRNFQTIKEEAINNRKERPDVVKEKKVVEEKVNNSNGGDPMDQYLQGLSRSKF